MDRLLKFFIIFLIPGSLFSQDPGVGPTPSTVNFYPASGTYTSTQAITLTCPLGAGTSIWYRTDGAPATTTDTPYTGPISVSSTETITAICAYTGATSINTSLAGITGWKINCPTGSTNSHGLTCASNGGTGTYPLSDFNLSFSGGVGSLYAASNNVGSGDPQILAIYQPNSVTCNSCTTIAQHVSFTENPLPTTSVLENSEFDQQMLFDAFGQTKILGQFSSQCQGSSSKMEINASGSWVKINVPCNKINIDMQIGGHIVGNGVGNCNATVQGSTPTYGCAVFDYIRDNLTNTTYAPVSSYCTSGSSCDTYILIQQPTWSYFAASNQHQIDIFNPASAGTNSSTRTISTNIITSTKGIVAKGKGIYNINNAVTYNSPTCSSSDILTTLASATAATSIINVPSGTCSISSQMTINFPAGVTDLTIKGQSVITCTGTPSTSGYSCTPTNNTHLVDAISAGASSMFAINAGSNKFRLTGFSFDGAGVGGKYNGEIQIVSGTSQGVRVDHNYYSDALYTNSTKFFLSQVAIAGVADHNYLDMQKFWQNDNGFVIQGPYNDGTSTGDGDNTWANPTLWGSSHMFYVENNYILGGYGNDVAVAGMIVLRYNYFDSPGALLQTHATKSSAFGRGARNAEAYKNYVTNSNNSAGDAFFGQKGSTVMIWGNTVGPKGGSNWFYDGCTDRACGSTTETAIPNGWWYCGTNAPGNTGGTSPYDGNSSNATGYPCLDGIGRGQNYSDKLNGQWFPNENLVSTGAPGHPPQYLEPTYAFNNDYGPLANAFNVHGTDLSTNNRDYYYDCGPLNPSCSSGFTGAFGTGSGILSSRPTTCTAGPGGTFGTSPTRSYGVGYFATDTNTLYVCTSTNTWTAIYTPYVYPHPLDL